MAVSRAGVGQLYNLIAGSSAAGTKTLTFNVSPAAESAYGVVAVGFVSGADISAATFTPTWNDVAMEPLLTAPLYFDDDKSMLMGYIIEAPAGGVTEVDIAYASLPTGVIKNLFVSAVVLSHVEPLDLDTIAASVVTAVGSTSVASSGVTVPSGVPADRVISVHQIGFLNAFTQFNGTRVTAPLSPGGGHMILGESRGAVSVVPTVTHALSTADWAAFGFNTDALPLDGLGFTSTPVNVLPGSFGADLYRLATPHPDRDYLVPPVGSADPNVIANGTVRTANGVAMPVWVKDPDDTLDYTLRWNEHLAPDDEVIAVEHTTTGSLRIISEAFEPDLTQFWVKGATRGVTHPVRVRFWTKRGRQHDFTAFIAGENN